ncbi:uncharacterized protein PFL1_04653 [Pseudozyma flocculosa PF-1]|uniref:Ras GEF n=2 Tax=Pseudozyma flocculosa TaxID=84751 RepID=A0A5C3FBE0_9BASI|nr:uncharacterized protein PFL1_04653 [Pseudozyma flocculosa PF-1]EPQ27909.1 hypothetical protein PFL1_04653 [Pseudozyma flocculosa PF-1]SPO41692.1 uncharacterized protein PSFLO_07174 [Pseudozyma flocculosa]
MEEPLDRGERKRPSLAAFWERPAKDGAAAAASDTQSSRPSAAPPPLQAAAGSAKTLPRSQGAGSFVGVQRLIQQYSASSAGGAAPAGPSETPKPLRRVRVSAAHTPAAADQPAKEAGPAAAAEFASPTRSRSWSKGGAANPPDAAPSETAAATEQGLNRSDDAATPALPAAAVPPALIVPMVIEPSDTASGLAQEDPGTKSGPHSPIIASAEAMGGADEPKATVSIDAGTASSASGSDAVHRLPGSSGMVASASADSAASSTGHGGGRGGAGFEPIIPRRSLSYDLGADSDKTFSTRPRSATRSYLAADDEPREERRQLSRTDFGDEAAYLAYRDAEKSRRMKKTLREQLKRRSKRRSGSVQAGEAAAGGYSHGGSPVTSTAVAAMLGRDEAFGAQAKLARPPRSTHSASSSVSSTQQQQRVPQRHERPGHGRQIWIDSGSSSSSRDFDHETEHDQDLAQSGLSSPRSLVDTFYDAELSGSSPTKIPPEASFLPRSSTHGSGGGGGGHGGTRSSKRDKERSLSLAEESDQLDAPWLSLGSPTLHEPTSTSTLRQDAMQQQERAKPSAVDQTPSRVDLTASSSRSSSSTSADLAASHQRWLAISSASGASTSSAPSSSPVSPASHSFGPSAMSPTTSQSFHAVGGPVVATPLRSHRTGAALPPPRPTPNSPLPPPPPGANPPGRSSSRMRGYTAAVHPSVGVRTGLDDANGRNRSFSLGQGALAGADASVSRERPAPATAPLTTIDGGLGVAGATPASIPVGRPSGLPPTLAQMGRSMSSMAAPSVPSDPVPTPQASTTLGPSGTIRGRPRGFTVGAVPASSGHGTYNASGRMLVTSKSRPRSLLCNEIVPGLDLAERRAPTINSPLERLNVQFAASSSSPASLAAGSAAARRHEAANASTAPLDDRHDAPSSSHRTASERGEAANGGADDAASDRRPSIGGRSRSGSSASLLQQVKSQPKSHASFVIAVVGHSQAGKSTVIKKGLRQFGLSKPHVLSEKVTSHSTACVVDQEQRTIEVLEIDASVLLNGPGKRFAWPKFLPHIDAVILCYDAAQISSFRGMSELLENFALSNLSTVMLACKSEVHPKAVDPYYASDMASVYNVGLAECTVESEEGKKRMRDCFSYLVKEVAKARTGKGRRPVASTVPPSHGQARPSQQQASPSRASLDGQPMPLDQEALRNQPDDSGASPHRSSLTLSSRARGDSAASGASSYLDPSPSRLGSLDVSMEQSSFEGSSSASGHNASSVSLAEWRNTPRKMSNATVSSNLSDAPSYTGSQEDDLALQESLAKARIGLQNARSAGGYVTIEELWDKLFHAAVSGNDERFRDMFMVFYRGFARPIDLLRQMEARFEALATGESSELVMNRFALIRLTNMLGEWVQSYPGDLSHPETYALLTSFYARLQQHPSTTHTASLIRYAVEAAAQAPDIDAVWSKAVEGAPTAPAVSEASGNGDDAVAAVSADSIAASASGGGGGGGSESDLLKPSTPASGASVSSSSIPATTAQGLAPGAHDDASSPVRSLSDVNLGRGGSETSLLPTPLDPFLDGRNRSASDVTTSSNEGAAANLRAFSAAANANSSLSASGSGGTVNAPGSGLASPASPSASYLSAEAALRPLDQKAALRAISNTLMEVDDEVIAAELTRLEWRLFTAIRPRDLLRHILVPRELRDGPVARSIAHFNYISAWVCSMILAQGKAKHRARLLEKFYNIASILRHDNNYGSLNSVLGGLSKTAVHRLKHTRELLKGKPVNKVHQSLVRLMSSERSNAAYRLALDNSEGATIPYVGVHLQDILSISDGNPSKRSDGLVHWRKFSLMDEAVMAIVRCQQYDRVIKPNPAVEKLIVDVPVMDDEALYERSLVVEPRTQPGQTIASSKIKDLKSFLSNASSSATNAV